MEEEVNTNISEKRTSSSFILKDEVKRTLLFEIAWETCNQVGGIYTVIRSKIPSTVEKWGTDNYFMIGPYFQQQVIAEFDPIFETDSAVGQTVSQLRNLGFEIHYGHWMVSGKPKVILFNPFTLYYKLGEIKYEFWEHHNISTPENDQLLNQVQSFGYQVKEFFRLLVQQPDFEYKVIAHFHEWMAGTPVPELRRINLPVKLLFTTHATMLGRYLAMNDPEFYSHLPFFDWQKEARYFNIEPIVAIERAATHGAHVFTTVSEVTGKECSQLLGREPDMILPNGLNIERFEALHTFQNLHLTYKQKIHEFVMGHFFQSYSFDLDNTLYFFTSGRFEYQNKGYDLTLEALARLNWKMKQANTDATVVFFFITKRPYHSINPDVLQSKALLEEVQRNCSVIQNQLGQRLFYKVTATNHGFDMPNLNSLVEEYTILRLRRTVQSWRTNRLPFVVTHNLHDDATDPILNFLRHANLVNNPTDKVKVIYHPDFISPANPLFRMEYHHFVRGCHLGVFPSYYEPWGYTPLECVASGIPSITSDLSGFGSYVSQHFPDHEKMGIYIVNRKYHNFYEAAEQLANSMLYYVQMSRRERIAQRNYVEAASVQFDWHELGKFYDMAYKMALER